MGSSLGKCCSESHKVEPNVSKNASSWCNEQDKEQSSPIKEIRGCTDIYALILMIAYFIILVVLLNYCISNGDIKRTLRGYDNCGNVCGERTENDFSDPNCKGANLTDKRLLLIKGVGRLILKPSSVERICVASCNDYPDYFGCLYLMHICNFMLIANLFSNDSRKFLNRCIPKKSLEQVDSFFSRTGVTDFFQEVSEDMDLCWKELSYMGLAALGLSFTILLLLRFAAGVVVYIVVLAISISSIASTIMLWLMWHGNKKLPNKHFVNGTTENKSLIGTVEQRIHTSYFAYAIISTIFTLIIFLVLLIMRKRIKLVIIIIKEAGAAIHSMPLLLAQPFVTYTFMAASVSLWLYFALWIESAGYLTKIGESNFRYLKDTTMKVTRWYNLLAFYWITQFFFGCQNMIIAGAITNWFFKIHKDQLHSPIQDSVLRLITYHLGSVAFGSLVVALVMLARIITWLLRNWEEKCGIKERENEEGWFSNKFTRMKGFHCCCFSLGCGIQKIVKFLSRNAYIQIAIQGCSFCKGGKRAVEVLTANALRLMAINSVGDWVLFLAKIFVVIGTVLLGINLIQVKDGVQHAWVLLVIAGIFTYAIAHSFISVYEMTIDCIFMCFCEECENDDGMNSPSHLSPELLDFMKVSNDNNERY